MNFKKVFVLLMLMSGTLSHTFAHAQLGVIGKVDGHPITVETRITDVDTLIGTVLQDFKLMRLNPLSLPTGSYPLHFGGAATRAILHVNQDLGLMQWETNSRLLKFNPVDLPTLVLEKMVEIRKLQDLKFPSTQDFAEMLSAELKGNGISPLTPEPVSICLHLGFKSCSLKLNFKEPGILRYINSNKSLLIFSDGDSILRLAQKSGSFLSPNGEKLIIVESPEVEDKAILKSGETLNGTELGTALSVRENKTTLTSGVKLQGAGASEHSDMEKSDMDAQYSVDTDTNSIYIEPGEIGGIPGTPKLTEEQLKDVFAENSQLKFDIIWRDFNSSKVKDPAHKLDLLKELSKKRLFAFAFADIYQANRKYLSQKASLYSKLGFQYKVTFLFQRFAYQMDYFGDAPGRPTSPQTELQLRTDVLQEKKLSRDNWEKITRNSKGSVLNFPLIGTTVELLYPDGSRWASIDLGQFNGYYGPGYNQKFVSVDNIVGAMKKLWDSCPQSKGQ